MAMDTVKREAEKHPSVKDKANDLIQDVKGEVQHEVSQIHGTRTPVNPTQSDHVVRRHVFGLSLGFFIGIVVFLVLVIAGFLIFGRP
jgi:hypothetical protein